MAAKPKIKFVDEVPAVTRSSRASEWDPFIDAAIENPAKVVVVEGQPNAGGTSSVKNVIANRPEAVKAGVYVSARKQDDDTYTYYITCQV